MQLFRLARHKYDVEPAPQFLFERRPIDFESADKTAGQFKTNSAGNGTYLAAGNQPPFIVTHSEQLCLRRSEAPSLTITADPSSTVAVLGSGTNDWSIRFYGKGCGQTEIEARERLQQVSMTCSGATVSVNTSPLSESGHRRGSLILDAPADASLVIYASYSSVQVRDMSDPVRVAAIHGRVTILDTTGRVDASAQVVDFAASRGMVNLSAELGINLKLMGPRFDGALVAWAQRNVRVLVPPGFVTPFQAVVSRPEDFVCRADFCSNMTQTKQGNLYLFTYRGDGKTAPDRFHLRSEHSTVVVDSSSARESDS